MSLIGNQWHIVHSDVAKAIIGSSPGIELLFSMKLVVVPDEVFFANAIYYFLRPDNHPYNKHPTGDYNNDYVHYPAGRHQTWEDGPDGRYSTGAAQFPEIKNINKSAKPIFFTRKVYKVRLCDLMDEFLASSNQSHTYCENNDIDSFVSRIRQPFNFTRDNYESKCR